MAGRRDFDVVVAGVAPSPARPIGDRVFFAGEACSKDHFGTAHAAYITAVSAAERIISVLAPAS